MLKRRFAVVLAAGALAGLPVAALAQPASSPQAVAAATCSDYPNQAAAQRAADTRDPDGDGIYCESLPCPCSSEAGGDAPTPTDLSPGRSCTRPRGVQRISFSATNYPNIRAHVRAAVRNGWPRTLVVNRPGADARRDRLLEDIPTRPGFDRDEICWRGSSRHGRPSLVECLPLGGQRTRARGVTDDTPRAAYGRGLA